MFHRWRHYILKKIHSAHVKCTEVWWLSGILKCTWFVCEVKWVETSCDLTRFTVTLLSVVRWTSRLLIHLPLWQLKMAAFALLIHRWGERCSRFNFKWSRAQSLRNLSLLNHSTCRSVHTCQNPPKSTSLWKNTNQYSYFVHEHQNISICSSKPSSAPISALQWVSPAVLKLELIQ